MSNAPALIMEINSIVERNGGRISVESQEDKGTSFVLEFKISVG